MRNVRHGSSLVREARAAGCAAALALSLGSAPAFGVIPIPAEIAFGEGAFTVDQATRIEVPRGDREAEAAARYLVDSWTRTNGLTLSV